MEIEARGDTGLDCADLTGFVAMAPRQQVTAAPMASHANSAFALDAADGSPMSAVFVDDVGNVGIGTTTPANHLHVNGGLTWGGLATEFAYSGIDASGLMGSGFTALRTSAGTSLIGFSPSFPVGSAPAVTVSAEWVAGSAYVAMTNGVLPTATGVRITNGSGTLTDQSFYFTAIGPR